MISFAFLLFFVLCVVVESFAAVDFNFGVFDTDHDSKLSEAEFNTWYTAMFKYSIAQGATTVEEEEDDHDDHDHDDHDDHDHKKRSGKHAPMHTPNKNTTTIHNNFFFSFF